MESSLDQPTRKVLKLLSSLNEEISPRRRELNGYPLPCVARPDVQAGVAGAAMDGEEVEVGVEAGEDRVFLAVLGEVGGGGCEDVRT